MVFSRWELARFQMPVTLSKNRNHENSGLRKYLTHGLENVVRAPEVSLP